MSQPRLISPMLDNYLMGDAISDQNGVRCCPAMKRDSDEKYIVKIISFPTSQSRLDALLLTGAYKSKEDALEYFRIMAESIVEEYEILQKLSKLDGFSSYESCQMVPNDDFGYDVYLLSSYKCSLEKYLTKTNFTYQDALKLGVDLCSALASCRRAGYLYVDLKPENIYVFDDGEYRIGDLGFLRLDSLKFASLADIYRSEYTAPEIADTFAPLNTTIDVYAVGMLLYRIFNNGTLPIMHDGIFPAPIHADNELAEIILKAIAQTPENRWQDPVEMGQALVAYMQEQVIPVVTVWFKEYEEDPEEPRGLYESENISNITRNVVPVLDEIYDISIDSIYTEDENGNLTFIDTSGEKYESANVDVNSTDYRSISADTSGIMSQADDLISHPAPPPVIPPDKVEIPMPEPITIVESEPIIESKTTLDMAIDDTQDLTADTIEAVDTDAYEDNENLTPVKIGKLLRNIAIAFIALVLAFCGYFYYRFVYIQDVTIDLAGSSDSLTVLVDSKVNSDKLYIVCIDANGNRFQKNVIDGKAVFTDLLPNSTYTVSIETTAFHKLVGKVSETYATPEQVNIVEFYAMPGIAEGSVKLSFITNPSDTSHLTGWKICYDAPDEEAKEIELTGNSVTIGGLNVGTEYTFRLVPVNKISYTGTTEVTYSPGMLVRAENLRDVSFQGGKLIVAWDAPEGANIRKWIVRCYDNQNYDKTVEVTETTATFHDVNITTTYSVEVTAEGMPQSERINVTKEEINIVNLMINDDTPDILILTWNADRAIPAGGWILTYAADGDEAKTISNINENTVTIMGYTSGALYSFTLTAADESVVNGGQLEFTAKMTEDLNLFGYKKGSLRFDLCNQSTNTVASKFKSGDTAYFSVSRNIYAGSPSGNDDVTIVITIKNSEGTVVSMKTKETTWREIWQTTYYKLPLPVLPETAGDYTVNVYFNKQLASSKNIAMQ